MTQQFQELQNWTLEVLKEIKKEIKAEHLPAASFYRTYFANRPINRLTSEEIFSAYEKELILGNQELADWVVNRWVFKHGDLYQHFAEHLSQINPDFDQIQMLTIEQSRQILEKAVSSFGAVPIYIFSLLNGVVFPEEILKELKRCALEERSKKEKEKGEEKEEKDLVKVIESQKREITRLQEKILGVQRKYTQDTEALKKQIKALQKRLNG